MLVGKTSTCIFSGKTREPLEPLSSVYGCIIGSESNLVAGRPPSPGPKHLHAARSVPSTAAGAKRRPLPQWSPQARLPHRLGRLKNNYDSRTNTKKKHLSITVFEVQMQQIMLLLLRVFKPHRPACETPRHTRRAAAVTDGEEGAACLNASNIIIRYVTTQDSTTNTGQENTPACVLKGTTIVDCHRTKPFFGSYFPSPCSTSSPRLFTSMISYWCTSFTVPALGESFCKGVLYNQTPTSTTAIAR